MNKDSVAFSTNSELTKDTILYANWKIKEYTITLVYGGATTRMTVSNGDYELPVPTKFDYKFVRWTNKDSITFTIKGHADERHHTVCSMGSKGVHHHFGRRE